MARKHWAVCDDCLIVVIITSHPDAGPEAQIPDEGEWAGFFPSCPVCGSTIAPADEDPTSTYDDENWHRRQAGKRTIMSLLEFMSKGELMTALDKACEYYEIDPANHGVTLDS